MDLFKNTPERIAIPLPGEPLSRYLTDDGTDSGVKDASSNHAAAATEWKIAPGARTVMLIKRMIVGYKDTGGGTVDEFGNIGVALTNGISFCKRNASGTLVDYTDGVPVTTNGDWARYCYDVQRVDWGNGPDVFTARWTFERDGYSIDLSAADGEYFCAELHDDLSGLDWLFFRVAGKVIKDRAS